MDRRFFGAPLARVAQLFIFLLILTPGLAAKADDRESVIIRCSASCGIVMARVSALGGTITHEYKNANAVAARVSIGGRAALLTSEGVLTVYKDAEVASPRPIESVTLEAATGVAPVMGQELQDILDAMPADYSFNNGLIGATTLHNAGHTGAGVIVAVIDTGTATVAGTFGAVIGGENFMPFAGEPAATSAINHPHGTWVGTQIVANVGFLFPDTSALARSVLAHAPDSVIPNFLSSGLSLIPMVGVAPNASIYALKVFPSTGAGAPE